MQNEYKVTLNCEDLSSSSAKQDGCIGVIHTQLLERLTSQIIEDVGQVSARRKDFEDVGELGGYTSSRLNYYITGKRGSGKSTFLRHLTERLGESNGKTLQFLHRYDPSESFGIHGDFFITVAAALKSKFQEAYEKASNHTCQFNDLYDKSKLELRGLDRAILRFSQGREALSGLTEHRAANLRRDDPEMNGMIRENFKRCLKLLCELCGVKAFVLLIDDIDIHTEQCYNVLETLRLYISNEYLVVLMAGNRALNLERVREKHFEEYNYKYHECDESGKGIRMNFIITHAAQYFAKLFPVRQQFELRSLYTLAKKRIPIKVMLKRNSSEEKEKSLNTWLREIFRITISSKESEVSPYVDFFMSLPLRNIIQILEYWVRVKLWDMLDLDGWLNQYDEGLENQCQKVISGSNDLKDLKEASNLAEEKNRSFIRRTNRNNIAYLVKTALNRSLVDLLPTSPNNWEPLTADDERTYYATMLHLCQNIGDLEHGYFLSSEGEYRSSDGLLILILAAGFKKNIRDLRGFITYILYGPATVALFWKALEQFRLVIKNKNTFLESQEDLRRSFEEYLHIGNWSSPSRWARHANMIWCYDSDDYRLHSGVLRIPERKEICCIQKYIKMGLSRRRKNQAALATATSLLVSMNKSDERDGSYYISIYSYLAYILRCIEVCEENFHSDERLGKDKITKELVQSLREMTLNYIPIKSCRRPEWQVGRKSGAKEPLCNESMRKPLKNDGLDTLMKKIAEWYFGVQEILKTSPDREDDISPHTMGEIWSDFYQQMRKRSHSSQNSSPAVEVTRKGWKEFNQIMNDFRGFFFSPEKMKMEETKKMTEFYRAAIGAFPLTKCLNLKIIKASKPK